jgi:hypothetical protein
MKLRQEIQFLQTEWTENVNTFKTHKILAESIESENTT